MNSVIHPTLGYRDARAALEFLVNVLGFEQVAVYDGGPDGTISQAVLRWPDGGIITLYSADRGGPSIADLAPMAAGKDAHLPFAIFIRVDDPDAVRDRVVAAGAGIARPLADSHRGDRGFTVRDPEGLYWNFGTYAAD